MALVIFVVRHVRLTKYAKSNGIFRMEVYIENVGYGNLVKQKSLSLLIIYNNSNRYDISEIQSIEKDNSIYLRIASGTRNKGLNGFLIIFSSRTLDTTLNYSLGVNELKNYEYLDIHDESSNDSYRYCTWHAISKSKPSYIYPMLFMVIITVKTVITSLASSIVKTTNINLYSVDVYKINGKHLTYSNNDKLCNVNKVSKMIEDYRTKRCPCYRKNNNPLLEYWFSKCYLFGEFRMKYFKNIEILYEKFL
ncbi:hypothetical protein H8356DRAFT_1359010 [Neocallimastix lanati (nom. inval.)]|nr:hypothetical protein H8356DRAFT_1359010 [Neocallimastix sp. JGI-2020a]